MTRRPSLARLEWAAAYRAARHARKGDTSGVMSCLMNTNNDLFRRALNCSPPIFPKSRVQYDWSDPLLLKGRTKADAAAWTAAHGWNPFARIAA